MKANEDTNVYKIMNFHKKIQSFTQKSIYSFGEFSSIWTDLATSMRRKNHCTTEHTQFCNSNLHSCISSPISTFNKFLMSLNLVELDWLAKQHVMILELVNQLEEIYKRTKEWNTGPLGLISTDEAFLFLCFYNLNKTKVSWLEQTLFVEQLLNKKSHNCTYHPIRSFL